MHITHIVAAAENGAIGKDNRLLWRLPDDMKFFKDKTSGHCIVTGRRNYESIPPGFRPLPGRTNIVVTRNISYDAPGAHVVTSIAAAVELAKNLGETELFIIGGGEIYAQTADIATRIYITRVHTEIEADTFYVGPDTAKWKLVWEEQHPANEKHAFPFTFCCYEKN
jgi:dihydrofolate reductase